MLRWIVEKKGTDLLWEGIYLLWFALCTAIIQSFKVGQANKSDQLSGYTKAQAFSITDYILFLSGTQCFWTGTQYFSQDESQDSP